MKNSNIDFNNNFKDFLDNSESYHLLINEIVNYQYIDSVSEEFKEEFKEVFTKLIKLSVEELMLNWEYKGTVLFINNSPINSIEPRNSKDLKEYFKENHPVYIHLLGKHVKSVVNYLITKPNLEQGYSLAYSLEKEARIFSNQPLKKAYRIF